MQDKYQSIRNKIKLPHKFNVSKTTSLFSPIQHAERTTQQLSESLFCAVNRLVDQLNISFQAYRDPDSFHFHFPQSLFPQVPRGSRNQITYERKIISEQENTFKDRLSEEQLAQIAEKGEFKVKSNIEYVTLPYVWRINTFLVWGRQKIQLVWHNSLAKIYGIMVEAKHQLFTFFPNQIGKLKKIPHKLFQTFFGAKSLQKVVSVDYRQELILDFWKKVMKEHYGESEEWGSSLWNYLYVYYDPSLQKPAQYDPSQIIYAKNRQKYDRIMAEYNKNKIQSDARANKLREVHQSFNQQWNKLKRKVALEIGEQLTALNNSVEQQPGSQQDLLVHGKENSDQRMLQILADRKFSLYLEHIQNQLPKKDVPLSVVNAVLIILRLFRAISTKYATKKTNLQRKRKQIEESVRKRHPIKSLYAPFFNRIVEQQFTPIAKGLEEQFYQRFVEDKNITGLLNESQRATYIEFWKLRSNYDTLQSAKRNELKQLHIPSRTFYSNYHLLPHQYQIIQNNQGQVKTYYMKKISDNLTVDTNTNFWKAKLYWMRIKTWSINCLVFLMYAAWTGPTGLRCLYGLTEFQYEKEVNYNSGEIYYNKRRTVIGTFRQVLEGIDQSRRAFEALPDLGILGKNVSRIFNYIECYIFRFLFTGIILTLICYPSIIVVFSMGAIVLVLTVWFWVPVILAVTYSFNIFIYQFETSFIPNRFIVRSAPIFVLIWSIIYFVFKTILLTLNLLLWAPLKSTFLFLYCLLQRYSRITFDKLMVFLFKKLGRTPSRDTSIARKISGPGMSSEFYMSINEEDVYVLIRSQLEQIYLAKFNQLVEEQIRKTTTRANNLLSTVLKPFQTYNSNKITFIHQNVNRLFQNYRRQYYEYTARYPCNPSGVRFTQEEIDNYFQNTVNIVKNFVTKFQIQGWIFDKYDLYEGMYEDLTRAVWQNVFGCGEQIFEPLEKLDARFKLEDQYKNEDGFNYSMKKNVGAVMKSLEGQVFLSHNNNVKLSPFKHNLLTREQKLEDICYVLQILENNSIVNTSLDLQRVETAFVPNLNIKEIKIIQEERRESQIKSYSNIIDL